MAYLRPSWPGQSDQHIVLDVLTTKDDKPLPHAMHSPVTSPY
jgi:hypothetical protein